MISTDRLDWTLLRSFLAVIDAGSLLGAAKRLGTHQPTLSRQIAELESQLGVPLFERTGRGLLPTEGARAIVDAARQMAQAAGAVESSLRSKAESTRGSVRISASAAMAFHLLPPCLTQMRLRHPGIDIDLVASNAVSNLLRREADIALRMIRPTQATVIGRRLGELPVGAFAATAYIQRRGRPNRLADLSHHDLVGMDADDSIIRGLQAVGLALTRDAFSVRCDDQLVYNRMVEEGAGIGMMPVFVGSRLIGVERLLPSLKGPSLPLWLLVHREIKGNPAIRSAYDLLAQEIPRRLLDAARPAGKPSGLRSRSVAR